LSKKKRRTQEEKRKLLIRGEMSYYDQHQPPVSVPPQQGMYGFSWIKAFWSLWFLILFNGFVGYPKDAYPPPGYPVQGYPQGYPPQGYPPQGYAPQYAAPPPRQETGFLEGWYVYVSLYLSPNLLIG
jgi:hypothetical protein